MLLREQRGGHQHGHLLAVLHRLERRPHRDLGLAVADVAADQPVHRDGLLHVPLDLVDRGELVGRLGATGRRPPAPAATGCRGRTRAPWTPCGPRTAGSAGRRSRGPPCGPGPWTSASPSRPSCAASAARRRRSGTAGRAGRWGRRAGRRAGRACSAAYSMTRYSRLGAVDRALHQLDVPADAVLLVHHVVAGLELQRVDRVAPPARHLAHVPGGRAAAAGDVVAGEHARAGTPRRRSRGSARRR